MDERKREAISGAMPFGLKKRCLFAFILNPFLCAKYEHRTVSCAFSSS
jgi:hypothetical protein